MMRFGRRMKMGFFGKLFSSRSGKKPDDKGQSGDIRKTAGAGPAMAARSKDAKSSQTSKAQKTEKKKS